MGGSEVLVVTYQNVIGSLCARDSRGVGSQYMQEAKVILESTDKKNEDGVVMATQQGGAEIRTDGKAPTLTAAAGMSGNNQPVYCNSEYAVRRLIPLECERLQGYPDNWTQVGELFDFMRYEVSGQEYVEAVYKYKDRTGKERKTSDAARYKALGNSIALPPWFYVLAKLSLACGADTTMASLFDGIGGFPLIWESLNGAGQCLWASEIEEFPIAVTTERFSYE